jgi:hypothetical protein
MSTDLPNMLPARRHEISRPEARRKAMESRLPPVAGV